VVVTGRTLPRSYKNDCPTFYGQSEDHCGSEAWIFTARVDHVRLMTHDAKSCVYAHRPKLTTAPCARFFDFEEQIMNFLVTLLGFTVQGAEKEVRAKDEYAGPGKHMLYLLQYGRFVMEMLLVRATDNFLTYIAELLALVFTTRPETLKSNEMVRLEEILQHSTMEDLVQYLAERRVERLSYQGMKDLQKDLADRLGFELFLSDESLARAIRIIEVRNLIVHNRGIVNRLFQTRTGDSKVAIGSPVRITLANTMIEDLDLLAKSVVQMDERAAVKFGLHRSRLLKPKNLDAAKKQRPRARANR
jgi:hypothetical protein